MEPNFKRIDKWSFSYLDKCYSGSGIYVMQFPNGKRYLGKTKHFNRRLREHFRDFSFASDWHAAARITFTNLKMLNTSDLPNAWAAKMKYEQETDIKTYIKKAHPDWKRITKERKKIAEREFFPYLMAAKRKYNAAIQEIEDKEKEYNEIRYQMACDFFKNVQLWLWEVPEEQITEAENYCLNQIAALNKKENYYNTAYPKEG